MISESKRVQSIVEVFASHGIKHIVFSPGSRNAPLVISLTNDSRFECISIVDERSAGFYALGMAIELNNPVIICCTSGSASLNYSSALSEAYYQKIPLIALTSDRPQEWINHGEGQSINQTDVFKNFVHSSFNIPISEDKDSIWHSQRMLNEAIINSTENKQPVHLNIPFREPLYNTIEKSILTVQHFNLVKIEKSIPFDTLNELAFTWNKTAKVLILCGQMKQNEKLNYLLEEISNKTQTVVLTENTSNLYNESFISTIDRTITSIKEKKHFNPELIISIGGAIVSKKIKSFLRSISTIEHWTIPQSPNTYEDTFQHLSKIIPIDAVTFFKLISPLLDSDKDTFYKNTWLAQYIKTSDKHSYFLKSVEWSDLKAFDIIYNTLPENSLLHLGNSSPIRYMQLFNQIKDVTYFSNRGVSGIDGSTSTACGAALINKGLNILISGDLSFMYDINALWNNNLPSNLRVIIINNGGGGIFSIIPGPSETNALSNYFEVETKVNIKKIASAHSLNYFSAKNELELDSVIGLFYDNKTNNARPAILEIFTPKELNASVLKNYFEALQ